MAGKLEIEIDTGLRLTLQQFETEFDILSFEDIELDSFPDSELPQMKEIIVDNKPQRPLKQLHFRCYSPKKDGCYPLKI